MSVKNIQNIKASVVQEGIGVTKKILISQDEAPNFAMRNFTIQPGGSMPKHVNRVEHEQYVLAGRAEISIGDVVYQIQKGDIVFIPAEVPHHYRNTGEETFEFLCLVPNIPDSTTILK